MIIYFVDQSLSSFKIIFVRFIKKFYIFVDVVKRRGYISVFVIK